MTILRLFDASNILVFDGTTETISMNLSMTSWMADSDIWLSFDESREAYWDAAVTIPSFSPLALQREWDLYWGDPWLGWTNYWHNFRHTFPEWEEGQSNVDAGDYLDCDWADPEEESCFVPTSYCFSHVRDNRISGTYLARFADSPDYLAGIPWEVFDRGTLDNFFLVYDSASAASSIDIENNYSPERSMVRSYGSMWTDYQDTTAEEVWPTIPGGDTGLAE